MDLSSWTCQWFWAAAALAIAFCAMLAPQCDRKVNSAIAVKNYICTVVKTQGEMKERVLYASYFFPYCFLKVLLFFVQMQSLWDRDQAATDPEAGACVSVVLWYTASTTSSGECQKSSSGFNWSSVRSKQTVMEWFWKLWIYLVIQISMWKCERLKSIRNYKLIKKLQCNANGQKKNVVAGISELL